MEQKNKNYTYEEIKQKLIHYCSYQDRCHQEVENKMKEFLLIPEAKENLLLFLIQENYLNEERFTRSYIRGKFYLKSWGKNKIQQHLKQKHITEKLISKCMDEIDALDYEKAIKKTWDIYYNKQKGLKEFQKKIKTTRYLISRGFEYEEILKNTTQD